LSLRCKAVSSSGIRNERLKRSMLLTNKTLRRNAETIRERERERERERCTLPKLQQQLSANATLLSLLLAAQEQRYAQYHVTPLVQ
jgi:hypothetical protein